MVVMMKLAFLHLENYYVILEKYSEFWLKHLNELEIEHILEVMVVKFILAIFLNNLDIYNNQSFQELCIDVATQRDVAKDYHKQWVRVLYHQPMLQLQC
ncbi:hypothetical protein QVD17_03602 [Tagetes erecta]|uniref:Uncharacterized protein n=1 Tax=Tagetes erecta TaxID=13708 RepID=A0AAD8L8M0_TARER|nr:hypothetical protein QVD17_03602 [Tagetes erecta]